MEQNKGCLCHATRIMTTFECWVLALGCFSSSKLEHSECDHASHHLHRPGHPDLQQAIMPYIPFGFAPCPSSMQFWSVKGAADLQAVFRVLGLLLPESLNTFSAAKYCKQHHIAPHDDRAYTQVGAGSRV